MTRDTPGRVSRTPALSPIMELICAVWIFFLVPEALGVVGIIQASCFCVYSTHFLPIPPVMDIGSTHKI